MNSGLNEIVADSLTDGIFLGFKMLFDSFKTVIVEHPVGTVITVLILVGLHVLDRKTRKRK